MAVFALLKAAWRSFPPRWRRAKSTEGCFASTAFAVLRNAANASRAARGPRGSAVYHARHQFRCQPVAGRIGIVEFAECDAVCLGCRLGRRNGIRRRNIHTRREMRSYHSHDERGAPAPLSNAQHSRKCVALDPNHTLKRDTFPGTRRHRPPYTRPLCATFRNASHTFPMQYKGRPTSRTA